jgi:ribose transport system substrate-binding protein
VNPKGTLVGVLALVALLAAACGPSGSSGSTSTGGKKLTVAYFNAIEANTYTLANWKGITDECKVLGCASTTQFDAGFGAVKQYQQMQDAITSGKYNTFVVEPVDGAVMVPVTRQAVAAGITVISVGTAISTDLDAVQPGVIGAYNIGYAASANGVQIAQLMQLACGSKDPCNVVYMPADLKASNENVRSKAAEDYINAVPSMKLIATPPSGFDAPSGLKAAQDLLTAHPNFDVIGGSAGQAIAGAIPAFRSAGLIGKIKIVSNGATVEECKWIRDGTMFAAVVQLPYTDGELAVQEAQKVLDGQASQVPAAVDEASISPIGTRLATLPSLSTPAGLKFTGEYTDT